MKVGLEGEIWQAAKCIKGWLKGFPMGVRNKVFDECEKGFGGEGLVVTDEFLGPEESVRRRIW